MSIRRRSIRRIQFVAFNSSPFNSSHIQFVATQFVAHSIRRTHFVACYNCLIACNPFRIPIKKKNKRTYQLITGYLLY